MKKNQPRQFKAIALSLLVICFSSCKKESIEKSSLSKDSDRLEMTSQEFEVLMKKLRGTTDKDQLNKVVASYTRSTDFTSLTESVKNSSISDSKTVEATGDETDPEEELNEIIESDALKAVLNSQGEIVVDGSIYKVTRYGTFLTKKANEFKLESIIEKVDSLNKSQSGNGIDNSVINVDISSLNAKQSEYPDMLTIDNDIIFIRTFQNDNVQNGTAQSTKATNSSDKSSYVVNADPAYDNMLTYQYSAYSGIESIWHTLTSNDTKYNYFNGDYRTSVLFYNRNYGLIKSIGLKVKQQKKGWFWWNKTNAEEIRLGWSSIEYTTPDRIGLQNPFKVDAATYRNNMVAVTPGGSNLFCLVIPADFTVFGRDISDQVVTEKDVKPLVDAGWSWLKNELQTKVNSIPSARYRVIDQEGREHYYTIAELEKMPKAFGWRGQYVTQNGEIKVFIGPYEEVAYNREMIEKDFDFSTSIVGIKVNSFGGSSPYVKDVEKNYKLKSSMVYGTTKRYGTWRGIKIQANL